MIRKFFPAIIVLCFIGSCHKSQVDEPAAIAQPIVFFKDDHINVVAVKMEQTPDKGVAFSFTTRYEIGLKKIEVLSGTTTSNLCVFFEAPAETESHSFKNYTAFDTLAGNKTNFYIIRYLTNNNDWAYSSLYQINMK